VCVLATAGRKVVEDVVMEHDVESVRLCQLVSVCVCVCVCGVESSECFSCVCGRHWAGKCDTQCARASCMW
jgi:hypothetical protein